jgi:hypothetical protein
VVPPIAIVAGVFVLFRAFRAWSQPSETEADTGEEDDAPELDDEYIARMEEELKKRN